MKNTERVKQDFLSESADDYVGLWSLIRRVKFDLGYKDPATVRGITMSLLGELIRQGLIKAGVPITTAEFQEWKLDPEKTLQRIEDEWDQLGTEPNMGDIVWFTTTEKGDDYVRVSRPSL